MAKVLELIFPAEWRRYFVNLDMTSIFDPFDKLEAEERRRIVEVTTEKIVIGKG
jgi:hypothetical protein